jgi:hypothetical protein
MTTPTVRHELTHEQLDDIAWKFLTSEFAGQDYLSWTIDRRLDAYVRHHGPHGLRYEGSVLQTLLERIMDRIGPRSAAQRCRPRAARTGDEETSAKLVSAPTAHELIRRDGGLPIADATRAAD